MIYDCFPFNNELLILELRLQLLDQVVDKFVILESTRTFWGDQKPLYFRDNQDRFSKWKDRIIHVVVDDMPDTTPIFREAHQRNCFKRALQHVDPDDVILFMDVDEFPKPAVIKKFRTGNVCWSLQMHHHVAYLNVRRIDFDYCPKILSGERWNSIRDLDKFRWVDNVWREDAWTKSGVENGHPIMPEAGWHFTYLGDMDQIRIKVMSGSHRWQSNTWQEMLSNYERDGVLGTERNRCMIMPFMRDLFPEELTRRTPWLFEQKLLVPWE